MVDVDEAEARYEALRERDRVIASLQSKQRMLPVFDKLLDQPARETIDERLSNALSALRAEAKTLALSLARAVFVELSIDDLRRISDQLRTFERHLDEHPSERLDCCHDLLVFLRDMREVEQPIRTIQLLGV